MGSPTAVLRGGPLEGCAVRPSPLGPFLAWPIGAAPLAYP